ncbi:roadblock/LC7 domain-containing protein [Streptomyces niveus]|uniref:Roadblock/LAMTOR2 domain-containing protein n=1 Tax=Streptomyces niveus TaxID=193462 RepID=A0A1U9R1H6_STRNV|nr:roadblock/LC7 domain-containing protein [Streptomyces niveus]AQU70270.1 hypothetical protein BBN63_32910 [Streptomyces niveus]
MKLPTAPTPNPAVTELLDSRIELIAGVRAAVVLSADGRHLHWTGGYDEETAERRAPLASALASLALTIAKEENGGTVRRTMLDMDDGYYIVAACGTRTFLALRADPGANLSNVGYELTQLTKQLAGLLDAERRTPTGGGTAA